MAATQVVKTASGTGLSINGYVLDPAFSAPSAGQTLAWNGSAFIPTTISASTGNFVFSGNGVDLSAPGTMTLGGTNTTGINIGVTNTAALALKSTSPMQFWSGLNNVASLDLNASFYPAADASGTLGLANHRWISGYFSGTVYALALSTGTQAATNTTAMTIAPSVVDGTSSIGLLINNATTLATGKLISIQNNGTERFSFKDNAGSSALTINATAFSTNAGGNVFQIVSGNFYLEFGGSGAVQVALGGSAPYSFFPTTDNGPTLGQSGNRWSNIFGTIHTQINNNLGTASAVGVTLQNNTLASAGTPQQYTALLEFNGQAWNGTISKTNKFAMVQQPLNGTTTHAQLFFQAASDGGAYATVSGINDIGTYNNSDAGFRPGATSYWDSAYATPKYTWTAASYAPFNDNANTLGASGARWKGVFNSGRVSGGYRALSATPATATTDDYILAFTITGARTLNLPAANACEPGHSIVVQEAANSAVAISITPNGTDKINGVNAAFSVARASGGVMLWTDGSSNWYVSGSN